MRNGVAIKTSNYDRDNVQSTILNMLLFFLHVFWFSVQLTLSVSQPNI